MLWKILFWQTVIIHEKLQSVEVAAPQSLGASEQDEIGVELDIQCFEQVGQGGQHGQAEAAGYAALGFDMYSLHLEEETLQ